MGKNYKLTVLCQEYQNQTAKFLEGKRMAAIVSKSSDHIVSTARVDKAGCLEERLENLLLDGLQSGEAKPVDDDFWQRLEAKVKVGK